MSDIGPLQPSRTPSASTERRKFCNQHSSPAFFNCHRIDEEETLVNLGNSESAQNPNNLALYRKYQIDFRDYFSCLLLGPI